MKVSDNDASLRAGNNNSLKTISFIAAVSALAIFIEPSRTLGAEDDGVALAIIYDTSGSMRDLVADSAGKSSPKYVIANRALISIAKQVEAIANKNAAASPKIAARPFNFERSGA